MSVQSDALMALVTAYMDTPDDARAVAHGRLWGNPLICTPRVYDDAEASATPVEAATLIGMQAEGLIVVDDDPAAARVRLSAERPGYENRATRRARRGKPGKVK